MEFLAGFEADGFTWRDIHFSSGAGIAADAGFASADAENAESAQFDALTGGEGLFEAFEDGVNCRLSFGARQASALDHVMNNILLDQRSLLAGAKWGCVANDLHRHSTDFAAIRKQRKLSAVEILASGQSGPGGVRFETMFRTTVSWI
jgi:hypothetical protein